MFDAGKPRMIGLPYGEKILPKSLTVSRVHERHRQMTDTIAMPLVEHNIVTFR